MFVAASPRGRGSTASRKSTLPDMRIEWPRNRRQQATRDVRECPSQLDGCALDFGPEADWPAVPVQHSVNVAGLAMARGRGLQNHRLRADASAARRFTHSHSASQTPWSRFRGSGAHAALIFTQVQATFLNAKQTTEIAHEGIAPPPTTRC